MALKIKPPKPPQQEAATTSSQSRSSSPVAPEYSPITPKVQPALPAVVPQEDGFQHPQPSLQPPPHTAPVAPMMEPPASPRNTKVPGAGLPNAGQHAPSAGPPQHPPQPPAIPETQYIPPPPPQPFSSEDNPDAIALRAAISSLQFQKQKATQDLRTLSVGRTQALADPERFRSDLVAGKLKEQRSNFGDLRAMMEGPSDDEDDDGEDEVVLGAQRFPDPAHTNDGPEILDSQPSRPASGQYTTTSAPPAPKSFPPIPGPQNVVRMPPINWDKYHIVGEPLDIMHEQQRRWPGSAAGQGIERGREHAVAAPYSAFHDHVDAQAGARGGAGATGTVSEHPMETRRASHRGHV